MSVPAGPMSGRFNRVRLEYIYNTLKKGPTEAGYAYFRARRRRRNVADDEPLLSESDQLAMSGAFDFNEEILARNAALIEAYRRSDSLEIKTLQWFLPFFHHAYFGGTYTLLRFADHFARLHGVENRFHCYDIGSDPRPRYGAQGGRGLSLSGRGAIHLRGRRRPGRAPARRRGDRHPVVQRLPRAPLRQGQGRSSSSSRTTSRSSMPRARGGPWSRRPTGSGFPAW